MVKECLAALDKMDNLEWAGEGVALCRRFEKFPCSLPISAQYERLLPLVQAALPPAEFEHTCDKRQAMTLDQVIDNVTAME